MRTAACKLCLGPVLCLLEIGFCPAAVMAPSAGTAPVPIGGGETPPWNEVASLLEVLLGSKESVSALLAQPALLRRALAVLNLATAVPDLEAQVRLINVARALYRTARAEAASADRPVKTTKAKAFILN